jgi:hypothetical protein
VKHPTLFDDRHPNPPLPRRPVVVGSASPRATYRSGLHIRGLALGGHAFTSSVPGVRQCHKCFVLLPEWAVAEGFYPMPCMGNVRRLER